MLKAMVLGLAVTVLGAAPWVVYQGQGSGKPGSGKKVVLVSGDEEYRSEEALPQLGRVLAKHHGLNCVVLFAIDPKTGIITGKGFKFGTSASEPFKASNVSYETHRDIALALTEAQRAVIIEKLEADRAVAEKAWGVASEAVANITKIIQIYKNPGAALLP